MRSAMNVLLVSLTVGLVGALGAGCSSSDSSSGSGSSDPDFNAIANQYSAPTGTYDPKNSGPTLAAYSDQQKQQADSGAFAAAFGGGTSTDGAVATAIQALPAGGGLQCAAPAAGATTGSCTCPNGGNVTFDYAGTQQTQNQSGVVDAVIKYKWNACAMAANTSVDGSMYFQTHIDQAKPAEQRTIVVMKLTVKNDAVTASIDLSYAQMDGKVWFIVKSSDGYVAVSGQGYSDSTKSGTIVIKDKTDTYTCTFQNGKGSCKGEKSGTTVDAG